MANKKLNREEKEILSNMKKALPKLSKKQKDKLLTGTEFLVSFTEHSDCGSAVT